MKIILASNNRGKCEEIQHYLNHSSFHIFPQSQLQIEEVAEPGLTFVENAIIKARHATDKANLPAIADDSGLIVPALNGAPGIYSARYAGPSGNSEANIAKLLANMADIPKPKRQAKFYCVMVYLRHADDPTPVICQGSWEGEIFLQPRGEHGFGYDPVFYVPKFGCSAAELPLAVKNQVSHRAQALQQMIEFLRNNG